MVQSTMVDKDLESRSMSPCDLLIGPNGIRQHVVGDLVSFRGPFFVKSNLECLTCSLYVSKPKKLGLKIRATVFGRFWANFRAKNKNTNF